MHEGRVVEVAPGGAATVAIAFWCTFSASSDTLKRKLRKDVNDKVFDIVFHSKLFCSVGRPCICFVMAIAWLLQNRFQFSEMTGRPEKSSAVCECVCVFYK